MTFPFHSGYNFDFLLASIPIQATLILFYLFKRNLPIRRSSFFLTVLLLNVAMTVFNILGCEILAFLDKVPLFLPYLINIVYFIVFVLEGWAFFVYTAEAAYAYKIIPRVLRWIALSPALVTIVFIFITPWAGSIFTIDAAQGYAEGPAYWILYLCDGIYIAASLGLLLTCIKKKAISPKGAIPMFAYNLVLILALLERALHMNITVMEYFSILAVLIAYLTIQNPALYRERKTRLFNKLAFDEIVNYSITEGIPFEVVGIKISNYEQIRSLHGNEQVSQLTVLVAHYLTENTPCFDVFYFGGGSYLLVRRQRKGRVDHAKAHPAKMVLDHIEERFLHPWNNARAEIATKIYSVLLPVDIEKVSAPVTANYIFFALNEAQANNAHTAKIIDETLLAKLDRRLAVQRAVARGLAEDRFEVYFQPIVSTGENRVTRLEALARLNDRELGFIPPMEFIRAAENDGTIIRVGARIFEKTCLFIAKHDLDALGIESVTVNLSAAQCLSPNLAENLLDTARGYNVPLSKIEIEITETALIDITALREQLQILVDAGAHLVLDDFGTGTSNLSRLVTLPFRVVKIDMSIAWSYFREGSTVLLHLLRMLQDTKYEIVVEGVEDQKMAVELKELGVDYLQGYYFSKPITGEALIDRIENEPDAFQI